MIRNMTLQIWLPGKGAVTEGDWRVNSQTAFCETPACAKLPRSFPPPSRRCRSTSPFRGGFFFFHEKRGQPMAPLLVFFGKRKNLKKGLHFPARYGMITGQDCNRYALKREVAAVWLVFPWSMSDFQTGRKNILSVWRKTWGEPCVGVRLCAFAPPCFRRFWNLPGFF